MPETDIGASPHSSKATYMDCVSPINKVDSCAPIFQIPELVIHILLFLDPQQVILLQRVSQLFRAIINDRTLWRTLYDAAHLPLPPGPFHWQSTEFLQRTLVRSARLAQRWTSEPINAIFTRSLTFYSSRKHEFLCGRFLVFLRETELVAHDFDTRSEQSLYKFSVEHAPIMVGATCCTAPTRGPLLYVGIYVKGTGRRPLGDYMKLFEFEAVDNSGRLTSPTIIDFPSFLPKPVSLSPFMESGNTPFVSIYDWVKVFAKATIFDTRNRTFYSFPEPAHTPESWLSPGYENIVLTMTHIIVFRANTSFVEKQLVQVYMTPDSKESHELCLSYEAIIAYRKSSSWSLLRESVTDSITGTTLLRLLHAYGPDSERQFSCVDLRLPARSAESDILSMSIDTYALFAIADIQYRKDYEFVQASPKGLARGLCFIGPVDQELHICKYSIDATGERCVGVVGRPSPLWTYASLELWFAASFDGMRGRLFYLWSVIRYMATTVVDLE